MKNAIELQILSFIFILINIINQVAGDICSDSVERCQKCCGTKCCYSDNYGHQNHGYSYRVSFYNLWYFWFVILFVLMSCFGGCGYYKQRQRFARSRGIGGMAFASHLTTQPVRTTRGRTLATTINPTSHSNFGFSQTGDDAGVNMQPPPYSEVMMQPNLYPAYKIDGRLPPYPGQPVIIAENPATLPVTETTDVPASGSTIPQPPPYSLFDASNQNVNNIQDDTANQFRDGIPQETQVTIPSQEVNRSV